MGKQICTRVGREGEKREREGGEREGVLMIIGNHIISNGMWMSKKIKIITRLICHGIPL